MEIVCRQNVLLEIDKILYLEYLHRKNLKMMYRGNRLGIWQDKGRLQVQY